MSDCEADQAIETREAQPGLEPEDPNIGVLVSVVEDLSDEV